MSVLGLFKQGLEIVNKVMPDSDKERELEKLLTQAQMEGQIKLNLADAASDDKFRTRWRPFIGWGVGAAFVACILTPLVCALFGIDLTEEQRAAVTAAYWPAGSVVCGMMGLRGFEKVKGAG